MKLKKIDITPMLWEMLSFHQITPKKVEYNCGTIWILATDGKRYSISVNECEDKMKMKPEFKDHAIFVLEDDNELMTAGLDEDSNLDEDNKAMNKCLIKQHSSIIKKLQSNSNLTAKDLQLIKDANEIHYNDEVNFNEHHEMALKMQIWLEE